MNAARSVSKRRLPWAALLLLPLAAPAAACAALAERAAVSRMAPALVQPRRFLEMMDRRIIQHKKISWL